MAVYVVIDIAIHDPDRYAQYAERVRPIIERYGGRYLARGGTVTTIAGGWKPERIVLIEFPSHDDVRRCFESGEYRTVAPLREHSTSSRAILVEGCGSSYLAGPQAVLTNSD